MHLSEGPTAPATAAPHTLGISSGSTVWAASVGESRGRPGFSQHLPIVVCCASGFEYGSELPSLLLFLPLQTVTLSHTGTPHTQRFQVGISPTLPSGQLNLKSSLLLNILLVHLLPALPGLWFSISQTLSAPTHPSNPLIKMANLKLSNSCENQTVEETLLDTILETAGRLWGSIWQEGGHVNTTAQR